MHLFINLLWLPVVFCRNESDYFGYNNLYMDGENEMDMDMAASAMPQVF